MKYPSVFIAIVVAWIVVDLLAFAFSDTQTTYRLYELSLLFSLGLFLIGFWRNK